MGADLLSAGGILAAFLAGGVALFAPCCIVFLAPSYLAAAAKNRRWRLLPLTFVFAAGLALVLVPITMGVSLIAGAIAMYHSVLYWAGGLLMIGLGLFALSGRMWSMPSVLRAPDTARSDTATFFSLGVFSGIASSCCAPVLAGVMTLSALSGSPTGGLVLGLAYVFGMVIPLFVMALLWDKRPERMRSLRAKPVRLRLGRFTLATNTVNLLVAVGFVVMGIAVIGQAGATEMTGADAPLVGMGAWLSDAFAWLLAITAPIPEAILGLALLALVSVFVLATLRDRSKHSPAPAVEEHACCDDAAPGSATDAETPHLATAPSKEHR
ncbi:cytochrome c biogenesis CcdA family protein [Tessaracoccus sp. OS52]|uniref:cytochrome c biogenesis CcdA family protein n=1 Tax=Tessaracoccus sp. OS52 TaxID=2886691 RepID=UPI001D12D945|nr:cytochrome c biogenesis CcdA family protein [Tessaracoccus sp. OS52]MCC2594156.1 cytochrome c biogenesis CcdA family protein [Tessaracoccus sp. OS52]